MEYVIIGACIVVAIAGGIVLYVKNKRTKNELGNTAVVVSKTSSSKLQASEVANDPVIQIGILPADAISDETKLVEITDSSLAMLDYALRRRFAFFEIKPGFTTDGFREYRMSLENEKFDKLIACVESLNNVISNDESLGDGFCIGHSYFCNLLPDTIDDQVLSGIVEYELIPLLKEYWFDEPTKVKDWSSNLRSAIK